ncbi:MAG: hypothetical protein J6Q53_04195 [Oscillospiraceae bacterium]|nr:hypothetical protein [Oscillospiraceae bacterium]
MNNITPEARAKVYADAIATFGANCQLVVALEEMSELQKEICKALRGDIHPAHLAEEVADATIMLEQVRQIFSINKPVCEMMDSKILRLRERIKCAKASHPPAVQQGYTPTCPRGYTDCIHDPAYIKFHHPEWYKELYGDMTPEEAALEENGCYDSFEEDPDMKYYCYDDEDK